VASQKNTARELRRIAFQTIYQIDARSERDIDAIRAGAHAEGEGIEPEAVDEAVDLALEAYRSRRAADQDIRALAPTWPASRQPAVDRAIIRLAHYEMTTGRDNPKRVVNDAVELAKKYSTDRSPVFINGVLDKILKRVLEERRGGGEPGGEAPSEQPEPEAPKARDEDVEVQVRPEASGLVEIKPMPDEDDPMSREED